MIYQFTCRLILTLCCTLGMVNAYPDLVLGDNRVLFSQSRPKPPPRLPPNRTRPGGGLDPAQQACQADGQAVTALVPQENPVLSVSPHPTFLFYVPDAAEDIASVEFSLFTADEKQRLFSTRFTPDQAPSIIPVSLPAEPEYALEAEQAYRWYFKVYCRGGGSGGASALTVDGWISRVGITPERQAQIDAVSPAVWYDSLASVADHLLVSPNDTNWRQHWQTLLESVGLEDLAEVNITEIDTDFSENVSEVEF